MAGKSRRIHEILRLFIVQEAAKKAAAISKKPSTQNWAYLQTMLRLIRAYDRGEYYQVSDDALVWIIAAALNYPGGPIRLDSGQTPFRAWSMMHM